MRNSTLISTYLSVLRIRIRDPVPFEPWIRDPESRISDPKTHFLELNVNFWVKSSRILCKLAQLFFFTSSKLI